MSLTILLPDGAQLNKETHDHDDAFCSKVTPPVPQGNRKQGFAAGGEPEAAANQRRHEVAFNKETTTMSMMDHDDPRRNQEAALTGDTGTANHPHGPTAYADALKGMDPLTAKIHALKAAELSLTAHTQGAIARRSEIRALKAEVAKLYFETVGKKPRARKAGK